MEKEIKNNDVLIIGSGVDLKGRRLARFIDNFRGVVIRCNKIYGDPADVGSRVDLFFTRWRSWFGTLTPLIKGTDYIAVNDCVGISPQECKIIADEVGWEAVSCGVVAVGYCLHRGARSISVIGFGYSPASRGFFPKGYTAAYPEKETLPTTKYNLDKNPHYNWALENAFLIYNKIKLL